MLGIENSAVWGESWGAGGRCGARPGGAEQGGGPCWGAGRRAWQVARDDKETALRAKDTLLIQPLTRMVVSGLATQCSSTSHWGSTSNKSKFGGHKSPVQFGDTEFRAWDTEETDGKMTEGEQKKWEWEGSARHPLH